MSRRYRLASLTVLLVLLLASASTHSDEHDDPDFPDWTWDDFDPDTDEVSDGELRFLDQPPVKAVHHHHNGIIIGSSSRVDGWVRLRQCHTQLDEISRAQVLFRAGRVRNIAVVESRNIGRAWVEDHSVQLTDIGKQARLCIDAESLSLVANADGSYSLNSGPFMRRFLDGFYPMRVSSEVELADSGLRFVSIRPTQQPGFSVELSANTIRFDAWFEGRLSTEIRLVPE